jgi:Ran GTPase-activating protein (RanGAP) involved in mRNA processing and transport
MGHYVEVTKEGEHKGKRGVITTDDKTGNPYKVTFANGTESDWLKPDELRSSGLADETAVLQRAMAARAPAVRAACEARLSVALRTALRTVRERVLVDALPLLSLVQSEPLRLQSSHLSFQEYFAARALCQEGTKLSGTPPWQWPAWWANAVELGAQMGDDFGRGLLRAAGVTGDTLDLSQKLGGDPPTVRRVLAAVVASAGKLRTLDLSQNRLDAEDARALAPALKTTALKSLSVAQNDIVGEAAQQLATAVLSCSSLEVLSGVPIKKLRADKLTKLDLQGKGLGVTEGIVLAELIQLSPVLQNCNLLKNNLDVESATMLAKIGAEKGIMLSSMKRDQTESKFTGQGLQPADGILIASDLKFMAVLTKLDVGYNSLDEQVALGIVRAARQQDKITFLGLGDCKIGPIGAKSIADYIQFTAALTNLDLRANNIGDDGTKAIAEALKVSLVLNNLELGLNNIGVDGAKAIAEALKVNAVLSKLYLHGNNIGDEGAKAIADALKLGTAVLTVLNLGYNKMGDEGAKAIADALKSGTAVLTKLELERNKIGDDGAKFAINLHASTHRTTDHFTPSLPLAMFCGCRLAIARLSKRNVTSTSNYSDEKPAGTILRHGWLGKAGTGILSVFYEKRYCVLHLPPEGVMLSMYDSMAMDKLTGSRLLLVQSTFLVSQAGSRLKVSASDSGKLIAPSLKAASASLASEWAQQIHRAHEVILELKTAAQHAAAVQEALVKRLEDVPASEREPVQRFGRRIWDSYGGAAVDTLLEHTPCIDIEYLIALGKIYLWHASTLRGLCSLTLVL